METRLVKINNMEDCKKDMEEAGELIKAGELVAFPTETVYGLGGNGLLPDAAKKIYAAKEHETKEEFYKMPHKKRKGRLL